MATGRNIITSALRKLGAVSANSPPTAEDMDASLNIFNALIESKSNEFLNIHTVTPYRFQFIAGQLNYSLGPTGDWVTTRPMRVEKVKLMMNPIITGSVITDDASTIFLNIKKVSDEEFSSIRMRGITNALPTKYLDQGGYPNRILHFWPVPNDASKAVELWLWEPLVIQSLDEELQLPLGYERYYTYALALELSDTFGKQPTPEMVQSFLEAQSEIKTLNQIDYVSEISEGARELNRNAVPYNIVDFLSGAAMLPRDRA